MTGLLTLLAAAYTVASLWGATDPDSEWVGWLTYMPGWLFIGCATWTVGAFLVYAFRTDAKIARGEKRGR